MTFTFPIKHISPTHVGRSKELFDQAIEVLPNLAA